MIATNRARRAQLRNLIRTNKRTQAARKAIAAGRPASAKSHLITAGLPVELADRYASAFSRGMTALELGQADIKLKGRVTKDVNVKLYDVQAFLTRLGSYRPKDKAAAAEFARVASLVSA